MENVKTENNQKDTASHNQPKSLFLNLSKLSKNQKISLATLSFFVAVIPIGTSAALLTTRLNSNAYLPATPPTPPITITITPTTTATPTATPALCKNPITSFKPQRPCRPPVAKDQEDIRAIKNRNGYLYANIQCQNGYKELYKAKSCLAEANLRTIAEQICQKKAVCPTPTITNKPPIIQTNSLPIAITGRPYSASIVVIDQDPKDTLSVTTSPLVNNLKLICKKTSTANKAECLLSGTPQKVGIFNINIKAIDNKGATTTKTLRLTVQNRPGPQRN